MQNKIRERIVKTIYACSVFLGVPAWIATKEPYMLSGFVFMFLVRGFYWWMDLDEKKKTPRNRLNELKRERAEFSTKTKRSYFYVFGLVIWVGVSVAGYSLHMSPKDEYGVAYLPFLYGSAILGVILWGIEIFRLFFNKKAG